MDLGEVIDGSASIDEKAEQLANFISNAFK